jgi:hypothetical protein
MALGVSALGKKRHRVDIARRLVVGSLRASYEDKKDVYYQADDSCGNALFRILDSSQPWWTEKDSWGRWKKVSTVDTATANSLPPLRLGRENFGLRLASADGRVNHTISQPSLPLSQVIHNFTDNNHNHSKQGQVRILAMYSHFSFALF